MKLIMVRHVETRANAEKKYIGHTGSDYTEKGKKQIEKLINILEKENIDRIYTSPLSRTLTMAGIFARKLNIQVVKDVSLKEMNFGIFEGRTYQQAEREFKDEWQEWVHDYINYRIPEGESFMDLYKRVTSFIDRIKDGEGTFLLVTHGGVIQTVITYLLDLGIGARWHFKISSAALVEIEYENDYGILLRLINNN